ncbi:MAG: helix-turn-helix domain-containing protein [Bryobacteraceae bacterium]
MDINELSRILNVPRGMFYSWCSEHRIAFIKAGRSLRFNALGVVASVPHCSAQNNET